MRPIIALTLLFLPVVWKVSQMHIPNTITYINAFSEPYLLEDTLLALDKLIFFAERQYFEANIDFVSGLRIAEGTV